MTSAIAGHSQGSPLFAEAAGAFLTQSDATELDGLLKKPAFMRELFQRYVRYVDQSEFQAICYLATPHSFDRAYFEFIMNRLGRPIDDAQFERLTGFGFIKRTSAGLIVHDQVRRFLAQRAPQTMRAGAQCRLDYLEAKNQRSAQMTFRCRRELIEEYIHFNHHFAAESRKQHLEDWQANILVPLQRAGDSSTLLRLFENGDVDAGFVRNSFELFGIGVDMMHLSGRYERAVALMEKRLSTPVEESSDTVEQRMFIAVRRLHHRMMYEPFAPIDEEIRKILASDDLSFRNRFELELMLHGHIGLQLQEPIVGLEELWRLLERSEVQGGPLYCSRVLRKYSEVCSMLERWDDAVAAAEWAEELALKAEARRYQVYSMCARAEAKRGQRAYGDAIALTGIARTIAIELGINGWIGHCWLLEAECRFAAGHESEAHEAAHNASQMYGVVKHTWGGVQSDYLLARLAMADSTSGAREALASCHDRAMLYGYLNDAASIRESMENNRVSREAVPLL